MKKFILSISEEFNNKHIEEFILTNLNMEVHSVGCGTVDFICDKKPKNFDSRIKKAFGNIMMCNVSYKTLECDYEN